MPFSIVHVQNPIRVVDENGNTQAVGADKGSTKLPIEIYGKNVANEYETVKIDNGRLMVATPAPVAPPNTEQVILVYYSVVAQNSTVTNTYIIPSGKKITLLQCSAAGDDPTVRSRVRVYYAPTGNIDGSSILLVLAYVGGINFVQDMTESFVGNGTAALIVQRSRLDNGAREIFCKITGYLT